MNRSLKESLIGGRSQHRRGLSLNGISKDTDENLDLFSMNSRSLSVASSDESDVSVKLGRLSVGSAKPYKIYDCQTDFFFYFFLRGHQFMGRSCLVAAGLH